MYLYCTLKQSRKTKFDLVFSILLYFIEIAKFHYIHATCNRTVCNKISFIALLWVYCKFKGVKLKEKEEEEDRKKNVASKCLLSIYVYVVHIIYLPSKLSTSYPHRTL